MTCTQTTTAGLTLAAFGLVFFGARVEAADRVLRKVPVAEKALRRVPAKLRRNYSKEHQDCNKKVLRQRSPQAYICKIAMLNQAAAALSIDPKRPYKKNKKLRQALQMALASRSLAMAVGDYKPVNAVEGLDKKRFLARAQACVGMGYLYDKLAALPGDKAASALLKADAKFPAPLNKKDFKDLVCRCSAKAEHLGQGAFIAADDALFAETKRSQYARGCFLDVKAGSSSLVNLKRTTPGAGPALAVGMSGAGLRVDDLTRVAKGRSFQFEHCLDRLGNRRRRKADLGKLRSCVCDVTKRWRFAKNDKDEQTSVRVNLVENQFDYILQVDAAGEVSDCDVASIKKRK